jgi:hypothetical protein
MINTLLYTIDNKRIRMKLFETGLFTREPALKWNFRAIHQRREEPLNTQA